MASHQDVSTKCAVEDYQLVHWLFLQPLQQPAVCMSIGFLDGMV